MLYARSIAERRSRRLVQASLGLSCEAAGLIPVRRGCWRFDEVLGPGNRGIPWTPTGEEFEPPAGWALNRCDYRLVFGLVRYARVVPIRQGLPGWSSSSSSSSPPHFLRSSIISSLLRISSTGPQFITEVVGCAGPSIWFSVFHLLLNRSCSWSIFPPFLCYWSRHGRGACGRDRGGTIGLSAAWAGEAVRWARRSGRPVCPGYRDRAG